MRDAANIYVQRAIVHVIDHLKQEVTASELDLDLTENERLRDYFASQVGNALSDQSTGSARFADEGDRSAAEACFRILSDGKRFIDSSQELARLLMKAMGTDQRIMRGDLAVCLYTASNYQATTFLALIKIDPGDALVQKVGTKNGKRVITFDVQTNVLPTAKERLQKAALVPPAGMYTDFDLLLLDAQVPGVAAFFAKTFLNTVAARDASATTPIFARTMHDAMKQLRLKPPDGVEPISVEESIALQAMTDNALRQPKIAISPFVARLPIEKKARQFVSEKLKKVFPQESTIQVDKTVAEKLLQKRRFKGDHGVLFEVETEYYEQVVKKIEQIGKSPVTRLTLDVTNLQWVK